MKRTSALAVLDFSDIPTGVWAVDAILKKAPIAFVRAGTVTDGRYLVVFGGSTASTRESLEEAIAMSDRAIIDHSFLPDAHPALFDAVFGKKHRAGGSLLIMETETASSIVRSVEAALKGTPVELIELRLSDSGLAGKGFAVMAGTLHDVEAAVVLAATGTGVDAPPPRGFSHRLIAAPHDVLEREITGATRFDTAPLLELDGETSQMLLGRVIGQVVPCVVYEGLQGVPMLIVQPLDKKLEPKGKAIVAADATRMAAPGELVSYEGGREAAMALEQTFVPVDHAIIAIVDGVNVA